jgi:hypothetical protein
MSDIVWQLNNNFAILAIEGILNMLHNEGCRELGRPHGLSASSDTSVLQDVPDGVRNLARRIVWRWWKTHGLPDAIRRLEVVNATTVSDTDNWELTAWIVNLLIKWLFWPEAPGGDDGAASRITVEGEPVGAEEIAEARARADPLLGDAKAVVEDDKT